MNAAASLTIHFTPAIVHEGKSIGHVALREPLACDVLAAEKARNAETGYQARQVRDRVLVAAVAGLDAEAVKLWPMPQFREAEKFVNGFSTAKRNGSSATEEPELLIELEPAIEKHNRRVDVLELRPPLAGEIETAQRELGVDPTPESMRRYQVVLVALVAGHPRTIIEQVPISQLDRAAQYLASFI